jgi:MFS family permease
MAVVALAPLGYLFVKSIPLLLLIRAFHGICIAAYGTGNSALVVDLSPAKNRGEVIGYMSLTNPIGTAVGPAIGGFLQEQAGYTPLFLLSCGLGVLGFLCASQVKEPRLLPESVGTHLVTNQSSQAPIDLPVTAENDQFWSLLKRPGLQIPAVVLLFTGLAFGAIATFVPLYIREAKVDLNAGWFYTAAALSSFCIRLFTGRASDRYGRGLFLTGGLVCYALSMLLLCQAHSAVHFLLAGLLEGAGGGTLIPMMMALLSDRCYPHERGRVFSLCVGGFDVGLALSGPILGTFAEPLGYQGIFSLTLGIALLAIGVFMTQNSKDLSHSFRFATGRGRDIYALEDRG